MLIGADTALAEEYTRSLGHLEGEYVDRVRKQRVTYAATLAADGRVTRLETTRTAPGAAQTHTILTFSGDSALLVEDGRRRSVRGATGAQALAGVASALTEQLFMRARLLGGDSVQMPILEISGRGVQMASIRWIGRDSAVAYSTSEPSPTYFRVSPSGQLLGVRFTRPPSIRIVRVAR